MSYITIDGLSTSKSIKEEIKLEINNLIKKFNTPTLSVILVGEDTASGVYIRSLRKQCDYVGIKLLTYELPENTPEKELLYLISVLNKSSEISGILIYLPLPPHINKFKVFSLIDKNKDLDCLNPYNIGLLNITSKSLKPCTPLGIIELLKRYNIKIEGKDCVVIGRSNIIGKPLATMLLAENATVTVCHSYTKNLSSITKRADILLVAVGKPKFITSNMVKEKSTVIDVGIHMQENGTMCGDVDFESVKNKVSHITPVPGGVGAMTTTMLLKNFLYAYKLQNKLIAP